MLAPPQSLARRLSPLLLLAALALLLAPALSAQAPSGQALGASPHSIAPPAPQAAEAELARQIEQIIGQGDAERAFWGIEIYSPSRRRTLYSLNAQRYFLPASTTKLFTTAAALALVGPGYQFRTRVGSRSRISRDGRLLGHLFLVGGGDPDLGGCELPYQPEQKENDEQACAPAKVLDRLAEEVAQRGVHEVTGDLIVDQSFFAPEPYPPGWAVGDILWAYGAPVRALSLADNVLTVRVEPGEQVNDRARLTWEPYTRFYQVENQVWTGPPGSETLLWVRRDPGSRVLEVSGFIALDHGRRTLHVAVEEPSEFIGELFRAALERKGVRVLGGLQVRYAPAPPFESEPASILPVVLAEHRSRPLVEDVTLINKRSQNLHAEMLLRLLGRSEPPASPLRERPRQPGEPPPRRGDGSTEAGLAVLRAWLANIGVNPDDVELYDGSGLSRRNLVTPHAVVQLLTYAQTQRWAALFRDSLAVAGVDGTLENRMKDSAARGRVRAKTGTVGHTNALAGYLETTAGETLIFAIYLNNHTLEEKRAVELLDQLCALLVELPPAP